MSRETETVSRNSPPFLFSVSRLADVRLSTGNDPLSQGALEGLPWPCGYGPEAGFASFAREGPARTGTLFLLDVLKVSSSSSSSSSSRFKIFW